MAAVAIGIGRRITVMAMRCQAPVDVLVRRRRTRSFSTRGPSTASKAGKHHHRAERGESNHGDPGVSKRSQERQRENQHGRQGHHHGAGTEQNRSTRGEHGPLGPLRRCHIPAASSSRNRDTTKRA